MIGYAKAEEMAARWKVSVRQVQLLCQNGRIEGASKFGNAWAIPEKTSKPTRTGSFKPGRKSKIKTFGSAYDKIKSKSGRRGIVNE